MKLVALFVLLSLASRPFAQGPGCEPAWVPAFGSHPGVLGEVNAALVHDDGGGPALFVGGAIGSAGGVPVQNVARFRDGEWSALGSGTPGSVSSLASFDDGSGMALYMGGTFWTAGGVDARHVARWDGAAWAPLGSGLAGGFTDVFAMAAHDDGSGPALYVAGQFTAAGGVPASNVARWDGSSWSALGAGLDGSVYALAVYGGELVAAGAFTHAGGVAANRLARWNGSAWAPLGAGAGGTVRCLAVFDGGGGEDLYAGGPFTSAGGVAANRVARWDGAAWSALGGGLLRSVTALGVFDDGSGSGPALFAGGRLLLLAPDAQSFLAKWTGSTWQSAAASPSSLPDEGASDGVVALVPFDDGAGEELFVGGAGFFPPDATSDELAQLAKWDGARWDRLSGGLDDQVESLLVFDGGSGPALHAGGYFRSAGGEPVRSVASWDGSAWNALGGGPRQGAQVLAAHDDGNGPALYAAGFLGVNGGSGGYVDRWDGAAWTSVGATFDNYVFALASFDDGGGPALYAAGSFGSVGGVAAPRLARWDGTAWSAVGGPTPLSVSALLVHDDGGGPALYVAGVFPALPPGSRWLQRFDGATWTPVGIGPNSGVAALATFDDGVGPPKLAVGGSFTMAGGAPALRVALWDGASWQALGGGLDTTVHALASFDDGSGPRLYAGGGDESTPGLIARFDGATWTQLGGGVSRRVLALAEFDDAGPRGPALVVGGQFASAYDSRDSYVALWQGCLDTSAPEIDCPDVVYAAERRGSPPGEVVHFAVSASDAADPAPALSVVPPSGSVFPPGVTLVTCTATDSAGNVAVRQLEVVVRERFRSGR